MSEGELRAHAERIAAIFGLPPDRAEAVAARMAVQPRHLMDDALCAVACDEGASVDAISELVESGHLSAGGPEFMRQVSLVAYKVVRALRFTGSPRDYQFTDDGEADCAEAIGAEPPEDPDEKRTLEKAYLETLAPRGGFALVSGHEVVTDGSGRPASLEWHATAGLAASGMPELLCFMVGRDVARGVFEVIAERLARGTPQFGRRIRGPEGGGDAALLRIYPKHVPERFTAAVDIFGEVKGVQVVFADAAGRLPWERGCDRDIAFAQPLLGVVPRGAAH